MLNRDVRELEDRCMDLFNSYKDIEPEVKRVVCSVILEKIKRLADEKIVLETQELYKQQQNKEVHDELHKG